MHSQTTKTGLDSIIKQAFFYWSKTLFYQFIVSLLYFSILFIVYYYFAAKFGILDMAFEGIEQSKGDFSLLQKSLVKIAEHPDYLTLSYILLGSKVFLYPLEIGLLKLYRKIDLQESYDISDLFSGYSGINFFIFTSYYLFWYFIFMYTVPTIILAIIWILTTYFVGPLMFFMNQRMFDAIRINFKALKSHFIPISVGFLVAFLFKYIGFLFFFVGALFTFPFATAMIYALYKNIFKENNQS